MTVHVVHRSADGDLHPDRKENCWHCRPRRIVEGTVTMTVDEALEYGREAQGRIKDEPEYYEYREGAQAAAVLAGEVDRLRTVLADQPRGHH